MRELVAQRRPGILTYGITPPKQSWDTERVARTAARQSERIAGLDVDGVVVYDLQDESARVDAERPFPYEEPADPVAYAFDRLDVDVPRVVYRCVARLDEVELAASLDRIRDADGLCVLVGAASHDQDTAMRLPDAYDLRRERWDDLPTGGVLIGERHAAERTEHDRVLRKVDAGCTFFVTQAVYAATATKDVLSDLVVACDERGIAVPPVLVTLTPCGSERTLTFLRWLGVEVPWWLENELLHAEDTLATSVDHAVQVLEDLVAWARPRGVPLGCNVESVSLSRAEVEASVELVHRAAAVLGRTADRTT